MMRLLLTAVFTFWLFSPATGWAKAKEKTQYVKGEPIVLAPDKAYIVYREVAEPRKEVLSVILIRELDAADQQAALASINAGKEDDEIANVVVPANQLTYDNADGQPVFVFAVRPGRYVLAGLGWGDQRVASALTCLCMGTVSFEAVAGRLTDIGTVLVASDGLPTTIPELTALVRGYDTNIVPRPYVAGLRPPSASKPLPIALTALEPKAAVYRAVDKFPNSVGGSVERLAPLAGVLAYDRDRVVDLEATSHSTAPSR